ncbi:MAG: hypothetical protein ACR2KV_11760 [Solirubrobacteraceae bacterium]
MLPPLPSAPGRRTALRAAVGLAAAIAVAAPAVALAGTSFIAPTPSGHVSVVLSRDGRQVTQSYIGYTQKCSDGSAYTDWDSFRAIPVSGSGAFRAGYDTGLVTQTDGAATDYVGSISGRVNKRATQVTGTAHFAFAVRKPDGTMITCDTGVITFRARD